MENWLSASGWQRIFLNQTIWINSAIILFGTLIVWWLLRTAIRFVSNRIAHYSEQRHVRFTAILVEILRSTSQSLLLIDRSKFQRSSEVKIGHLSQVTQLISDVQLARR